MEEKGQYIMSLDASTKVVGIAIFEDMGNHGELKLLTYLTPKLKPTPATKTEELFQKVNLFRDEYLIKYKDLGIKTVVLEEPLLKSNNLYVATTLIKYNGMLSKAIYDVLGIVPEYISSYDARAYAFPELLAKRRFKKDGTPLTEKQIEKNDPVLFGAYDLNKTDKKKVVWDLVSDSYPSIIWERDKNGKLIKETYDLSDALTCGIAYQYKNGLWDR